MFTLLVLCRTINAAFDNFTHVKKKGKEKNYFTKLCLLNRWCVFFVKIVGVLSLS